MRFNLLEEVAIEDELILQVKGGGSHIKALRINRVQHPKEPAKSKSGGRTRIRISSLLKITPGRLIMGAGTPRAGARVQVVHGPEVRFRWVPTYTQQTRIVSPLSPIHVVL